MTQDKSKPGHRKLWQDVVDKAITSTVASGNRFSVEEVLDSVGIHSLSIHRIQALEYCNKILNPHQKANNTGGHR